MFFLRIQVVCFPLSFSLFAEEIAGRVVRVADGDTITVLVTTGTTGILPVAAKHGLWQDKSPIEPESFRKAKREKR